MVFKAVRQMLIQVSNCAYFKVVSRKLDGVGPVDNIPAPA